MEKNKYTKNFDLWNQEKISVHKRAISPDFFFLEWEIWWASLGINIGSEIDGKNNTYERPILVLRKINEDLLLAIPITSTPKTGCGFYPISYRGTQFTLCFTQIRTLDVRRLIRLISRISESDFEVIKAKAVEFIIFRQNETPITGGISVDMSGI